MSQKPVTIEQFRQILQIKNDGIGIGEIVRRTGISRNSMGKYLALLDTTAPAPSKELTTKELADKAYNNDRLELNAQKHQQLFQHFNLTNPSLLKQVEDKDDFLFSSNVSLNSVN